MIEPVTISDATRIYALVEPFDHDVPRYVGKTTQPLRLRLLAHKRAARRGAKLPVHYWLRKAMLIGHGPAIRWIETVPAGGDWVARERYWIQSARDIGHDILNLTDGGEGLCGHKFSDQHRARIAASLRRGQHHACDSCGSTFYRKPKDAKRPHLFCSRACYQTWQRGRTKPMPRRR